jgi:hypothetical protein
VKPARILVVTVGVLLAARAAPEDAGTAATPGPGGAAVVASATPLPSHIPAPGAPTTASRGEDLVALGPLLPRPEDFAAVLPPPPHKVTLENSYGTVTVTHAAHLARRVACKACHGPGPIQKIGRFQPRQAHDACRACHVQLAKGPTACQGCHVKRTTVEPVLAVGPTPGSAQQKARDSSAPAPLPGPAGFAAAPGGNPGQFDAIAAAAAFDAAAAWPAPPGTIEAAGGSDGPAPRPDLAPAAAHRMAYTGASLVASTTAPPAPGVSLRVSSEQGGFEIAESLDWASAGRSQRALGLLGGGVVLPIRSGWTAHLLGVGGFDASDTKWTTFLPALGARASLAWATPNRYVQSIDVTVTAVADAVRARDPGGKTVSGGVLSIGVSAGMGLGASR